MENNIGANIASARHNQHMTQEQLAEFSDITINYLSKIERGIATQVSANTLYKISKVLKIPMEKLILDTVEPSDNKPNFGPNQQQLNNYLNKLDDRASEKLSKSLLDVLKFSSNSPLK